MSEHDDRMKAEAERRQVDEAKAREAKEAEEAKKAEASRREATDADQGGATTKDDTLDAGVPMEEGSPGERQGPEDAFGEGLKRGDYSDRVGKNHAESVPLEGGGEPVFAEDEDGEQVQVDNAPRSELRDQVARTEEVGDDSGLKGGVETTAA